MNRLPIRCALVLLAAAAGCTEPNPSWVGDTPGLDAADDARTDEAEVPPADDGGPAEADDAPDDDAATDEASPDDADGDGPADEASPDDRDGDGVPNDADNCPAIWNPGQEDCDGDNTGDRCETGDADSDTLPDPLDLCACAPAAGTHDEDGDTLVDECDDCPLVPDPTQANADLDGLGDACEPPSAPEQALRVARFDSFVAAPGGPDWHVAAGSWSGEPDRWVQTDEASSATILASTWTGGGDLFAQTVLRAISGRPGAGLPKRAGLVVRAARLVSGGVRWYSCTVDETTDTVELMSWDDAEYLVLGQAPAGIPIELGATDYRLSFLAVGHGLACALEAPVTDPVVVTATDDRFSDGAPGLRSYRLAASFGGLMVAAPR
jgi:hypothetical protein